MKRKQIKPKTNSTNNSKQTAVTTQHKHTQKKKTDKKPNKQKQNKTMGETKEF